jgi:hypothetical protein
MGMQINHPTILAHEGAVARVKHHATPCRYDARLQAHQLLELMPLLLAKACLTLLGKYLGDALPNGCLNEGVQVIKRAAQSLRKQAPDGAFTHAHIARQKEEAHRTEFFLWAGSSCQVLNRESILHEVPSANRGNLSLQFQTR